jgi:hypothetical protein
MTQKLEEKIQRIVHDIVHYGWDQAANVRPMNTKKLEGFKKEIETLLKEIERDICTYATTNGYQCGMIEAAAQISDIENHEFKDLLFCDQVKINQLIEHDLSHPKEREQYLSKNQEENRSNV